mmetsp:Transcript_35379/g.88069  ORF Transcript_35379/g.88069 Transcript_35379/m.88069 type:complete len:317 (+) Transcript_35379:1089-2039(+)
MRDLERDHREGEDLRGEGFGRGDADLRPGVQVDSPVRLARDRGADLVAHADAEALVLLGELQRGEGVRRLPRLRDCDEDILLEENRVAVSELGAVLDLDRDAREVLDQVLAEQRGVPRGAARHDDDASGGSQPVHVHGEAAQEELPLARLHAAAHALLEDFWLLADLLEHEVLVRALLDLLQRQLDLLHLAAQLHVVQRLDLIAVLARDDHHVAVVEVAHLLRALDHRRRVRREQVLVGADAEDEGGAPARADEHIRLVDGQHRQPEGALDLRECLPHRLLEGHPLLLADVGDQVRDQLGVRVARHDVALALQLGA